MEMMKMDCSEAHYIMKTACLIKLEMQKQDDWPSKVPGRNKGRTLALPELILRASNADMFALT